MPDSKANEGDVLPSTDRKLMRKDQPMSYCLGTTEARAERFATVKKVPFDTNIHARPLGFITLNKLLNISGACFLICKVGKVRPTISQRSNELMNVKQLSKYLGQSKCSVNVGYYVYS